MGDQPLRHHLFSFRGGAPPTPVDPGGTGRRFRERSTPQGHTLSLSLTGLLRDRGGGVCEGPESNEQEDSDGVVPFF